MDEREQQIDDEEQQKEDAKKKRRDARKKNEAERKSALQAEHQDFCEVCKQGGEILLCDGCPKAFHKVCLEPEFEDIPEGIWLCQECTENGVTVDEDAIAAMNETVNIKILTFLNLVFRLMRMPSQKIWILVLSAR